MTRAWVERDRVLPPPTLRGRTRARARETARAVVVVPMGIRAAVPAASREAADHNRALVGVAQFSSSTKTGCAALVLMEDPPTVQLAKLAFATCRPRALMSEPAIAKTQASGAADTGNRSRTMAAPRTALTARATAKLVATLGSVASSQAEMAWAKSSLAAAAKTRRGTARADQAIHRSTFSGIKVNLRSAPATLPATGPTEPSERSFAET